jgi:hypothetical protein
MKKTILISILIIACSGCRCFIPNSIKRESSLIKLDVNTCIKEVGIIQEDDSINEEQKLKKSNYKMMKTLKRLQPHVENLDNYTHGRKSTK